MSCWHRWDLHVHTPCSVLNNQFGNPDDPRTWAGYVSELEQRAGKLGIVGIGVTDYFSIEGYKRLLSEQGRGRLGGILLIPNVELRVGPIIIESTDGKEDTVTKVNFHVLFSPGISPDKIDQDFLWKVEFCDKANPSGSMSTLTLRPDDLIRCGREVRERNSKLQNFANQGDLELGMNETCIDLTQLGKALREFGQRHPGSHLTVVASSDASKIPFGTAAHSSRTTLLQLSNAVFSSNRSDRDHYLGKCDDPPGNVCNELGSLKPCLWGCDAHSIERLLEPAERRYCWIKSEPTWDGLRQVVLEPEERVIVQDSCPELVKSAYTIKSLFIPSQEVASDFSLSETNVDLSPGLVTVVGGRGSGKTALLDVLACAFPEGRKATLESPTSFVNRIVGTAANGWTEKALQSRVSFADNQDTDYRLGRPEASTPSREGATANYLPQDRLDQITGDPKKLQAAIRELVFEQSTGLRSSYDTALRRINSLGDNQLRLCADLDALRERTAAIPDKKGVCDQLQGQLLDVTQRMTSIQQETNGDVKLEKVMNDYREVTKKRTDLQSFLYDIGLAVESSKQALGILLEVQAARSSLASPKDDDVVLAVAQLATAIESVQTLVISLDEVAASRSASLADIAQTIAVLEAQQKNYEGAKQQLVDLSNRKSDLETRFGQAQRDLEELQQMEGSGIQNKVDDLLTGFNSVIDEYSKISQQFRTELATLSEQWGGLLEGLRFGVAVNWDKTGVGEQCLEDVNRRRVDEAKLKECLMGFDVDLGQYFAGETDSLKLRTDVKAIIQLVKDGLRKGVTVSAFLTHLLSADAFSVWLEPALDGVPLAQLSMGGRAVVLLKIVLAQGDYPLIMDQPEQGLDNTYVFEKLVPAIREAKHHRQIILATHNANLVVNTDAEQVIVAHCDGRTIEYSSGSLENPRTRQQVATLLEGGMDALRKREQRYQLKFD
jgi:energy-coupling factor transporter ATP-binding protein EcfA2